MRILRRKRLHLTQEHHILIILLLQDRLGAAQVVATHHLSLKLLLHFILTRVHAACLIVVA